MADSCLGGCWGCVADVRIDRPRRQGSLLVEDACRRLSRAGASGHAPVGGVCQHAYCGGKARYGLFPRRQYHVVLSGNPDVVRAELARRKVSYAVTNRNDPTIFLPDTGPWWHVVLTHGKWRVIALSP